MMFRRVSRNPFILVGLILLVLSGLAYFGVLPVLGYAIDLNKPRLSINFGSTVAYCKIAINGETVIEDNIGVNFVANRVVNVEKGDIVDIWYRHEEGYSGYAKVRIAKIPTSKNEPGCIEVLSVSGRGKPGLKHDIILEVYVVYEGRMIGSSEYVYIDIPDAPFMPEPEPEPEPKPEPTTPVYTPTITTTTATITSIVATTTTTKTPIITIVEETTITKTETLTVTIFDTVTTTVTATVTDIKENPYTQNRITALILGIAGALSMIIGFRRVT